MRSRGSRSTTYTARSTAVRQLLQPTRGRIGMRYRHHRETRARKINSTTGGPVRHHRGTRGCSYRHHRGTRQTQLTAPQGVLLLESGGRGTRDRAMMQAKARNTDTSRPRRQRPTHECRGGLVRKIENPNAPRAHAIGSPVPGWRSGTDSPSIRTNSFSTSMHRICTKYCNRLYNWRRFSGLYD
jgi:hypothetical protein